MSNILETRFFSIRGDILKALIEGEVGQLSPDLLKILDNSIQNPIVTCFCDDDITEHPHVRQVPVEDRSDFLGWVRAKDPFDLPLFVSVSDDFDDRISDLFAEYRKERGQHLDG